MTSKYNNQIYDMYEKEVEKNEKLSRELKQVKRENKELRAEVDRLNKIVDNIDKIVENAVNKAVAKVVKEYEEKVEALENTIRVQSIEIDRLRNQINKNSSNSSKPSSTDIIRPKKEKTGANQYNYRTKTGNKNGGQFGHTGHNLSKQKIENLIKESKIEVKVIPHYIKGSSKDKEIIKYRLGIKVIPYIEKHMFFCSEKSTENLPVDFYTDVTYDSSVKALCVELGVYNVIPYNRVSDLISILTSNMITISEGTLDNFYKEFGLKCSKTIDNITNNVLNTKCMKTDETTSECDGKKIYFRNYSDENNVVYKVHYNKGHKPIKEDNILTRYAGTIMGDHDTSLYSYGMKNLECNIHTGRYLEEIEQNVYETYWQYEMKAFLFRLNNTRKYAIQYGIESFSEEQIKEYRAEYDKILAKAIVENENIKSTYYKKKAERIRNKLVKYKENQLYFIEDFSLPFDNNLSERDLRMIKNKTKISGGFRSFEGAKAYANAMSIIKTSIKRKINPFNSIVDVFNNKILFA